MNAPLSKMTMAQLQRALELKQEIESLETQLSALVGAAPSAASRPAPARVPAPPAARPASPGSGRYVRTPEDRARMSAILKAKWAQRRKAQAAATPAKESFAARHKLSNASRAKVLAAISARWARTRLAN